MRLYIVTKDGAIPHWLGTQAEAKAYAREIGAEWQQYDVPTPKEELLEFLNHCDVVRAAIYKMVNASVQEALEERGAQEPQAAQRPTPAGAAKLRAGRECDDLVEFILEADGFVLSNLIGACIERLTRLRAEAQS